MLTQKDLRWNYQSFSFYSKLNLLPVTFKPNFLLGGPRQMECEGSSIWREIGFKLIQIMFTAQTCFISFRTAQNASGEDKEADWDFVPIMLILSASHLNINFLTYFTFDCFSELNTKIYNEILKLRGKLRQTKFLKNYFNKRFIDH